MTFTLCATGNVGRTELSFEEDERLDERRDLLSKLFKLAPKSGERINRINLSLLDTASHNAESLRLVAFDVEKILILTPIELQPLVEDALANLIKHYVKARSSHKFSAKTFQRSDSDVPSGSHVRVATKANPFEFTEIIDDVVFMDRPRDTQKQNPDQKKRRGAYLVAKDDSSETHIFVPMIELVEFSRQ